MKKKVTAEIDVEADSILGLVGVSRERAKEIGSEIKTLLDASPTHWQSPLRETLMKYNDAELILVFGIWCHILVGLAEDA